MTLYALGDLRPTLPPQGEYWVAPNAVVLGDVVLHRNASVWFGAVLRGDTDRLTVGENSIIGAGAVVKKDVPANVIVAGVPAKIVREIKTD